MLTSLVMQLSVYFWLWWSARSCDAYCNLFITVCPVDVAYCLCFSCC